MVAAGIFLNSSERQVLELTPGLGISQKRVGRWQFALCVCMCLEMAVLGAPDRLRGVFISNLCEFLGNTSLSPFRSMEQHLFFSSSF